MSRARSVWFEEPGVAKIREETLDPPRDGEVLVRVLATGVSAGSERLVLLREVPRELHGTMALPAMRGSFDLPICYGYASVGDCEGRRVFSLRPHVDAFYARPDELRDVPRSIPAARATLAANLETAINVVWDAQIGLGDRVVVLGLGVVGALVAYLARRAGATSVIAVERSAKRRALGRELGVEAIEVAAPGAIREADAIVEASGSPELLRAVLTNVGFEARVVVASWYGTRSVELPLGGQFHPSRATLRSSQVGAIPPERRARWDASRRFELVRELLLDPELDRLVSLPIPLADAPLFYAALARGAELCPPHVVFDTTLL